MGQLEYRCKICRAKTDNRICWECHANNCKPCKVCGKPTPTITRTGKIARRNTCVACTSSATADLRRSGVRCKVCNRKTHKASIFYQVCSDCQKIMAACPVCDSVMSKYRKRGKLRITCSNRCRKLLYPTTSEQAKKAQRTNHARHVFKSHPNKLARMSQEYIEWRNAVFKRDNFTYQNCDAHSGNGKTINLHPHHIKPFATYLKLRYEISNGKTLCSECHRKNHTHVFIGRLSRKRLLARTLGKLQIPLFGQN